MKNKKLRRLKHQFRAIAPHLSTLEIASRLQSEGLIEIDRDRYCETQKMHNIPRDEFMAVIERILNDEKIKIFES